MHWADGVTSRRRFKRLHTPRGLLLTLLMLAPPPLGAMPAEPVVIGSKNFTESYLLAEIAAQWLETAGIPVERRFGFGGTKVSYEALERGDIDLYPEYTGTISEVIVSRPDLTSIPALDKVLGTRGLRIVAALGFNNTYAIAVDGKVARELGLRSISELARQPGLTIGLSHEFRERRDGWPALSALYGLKQEPLGIEHGLAYQAVAEGKIQVTDAYSTDGDIVRYGLTLLEDDRNYFPDYQAVWLARADLDARIAERLAELGNRIDDTLMRRLNANVVVDNTAVAEVASQFVASIDPRSLAGRERSRGGSMTANVVRHLQLTLLALLAASIAGTALALLSYRYRPLSSALLYVAGLLQTVPSIALLALMLPLLGVGFLPAVIALFLYALLPILRSTLTALAAIDPLYRRVASAMGMTSAQEFRHVLLPLALPHVISGVRTASVISIGTATLAAFIGAGGLGQPIVTGLALNDTRLILEGAIPAALLAIVTDLGFDLLERTLVPPHMRSTRLTG